MSGKPWFDAPPTGSSLASKTRLQRHIPALSVSSATLELVRLVLDTTIFVAAFRSHSGASRKLLQLVLARAFLPVVSPALYLEYESVLTRPDQIAAHGISAQRVEQALVYFAGFTEKVRIHFS